MAKEEDKLQNLLHKHYRPIVEKHLQTLGILDEKYHLFQSNYQKVDASLKQNLKNHHQNQETFDKEYDDAVAKLHDEYKKNTTTLEKEKQKAKDQHNKRIEEIEESFENKRSLNKLKSQKVSANYDYAVKEANKNVLETEKAADKNIDDATSRHNEHMSELLKETNIKHAVNENTLAHARVKFDVAHDEIKKDHERKREETKEKKQEFEASFQEELTELEKEYSEALKPLDKAIDTLKKKQDKERKGLRDKHQKALNKLENYKKEAQKIGDNATVSKQDKKIKEQKKLQKNELESLQEQHRHDLEAEEAEKQDVIESYKKRFSQAKSRGIASLKQFLETLEEHRMQELLQIEEQNKNFNQTFARFQKDKKAIRLDYDLQNVNYNRALDEAKAENEHLKAVSKPENDLKENEAKFHMNAEMNELNKALNVAKAKHKRDVDTAENDLDLAMKSFDKKAKTLQYHLEHDCENQQIEKALKYYHQDHETESMILDHHILHSKNYAALKNDEFKTVKPDFIHEIDKRTERKITAYEEMLEDAKRDHDNIVEKIYSTYDKERAVYVKNHRELLDEHRKILSQLKRKQDMELKQYEEKIDNLDEKKDRKTIEQMDKELEQKRTAHSHAYREKEEELEKRRSIYKRMLDTVEKKCNQSVEEAETLLYHITDQLNGAIKETKERGETEKRMLKEMGSEIALRTSLFWSFQEDRQKTTLEEAKNYLNTRIHRIKNRKTKNENTLSDRLEAAESEHSAFKKKHENAQETIDRNYDKELTAIEREKEEKYNEHREHYEEEKRNLELYILKLKKRHEETMESYKEKAQASERQYFSEKEKNEETYKAELDRLQNEFEEEKTRKEKRFNKLIDTYDEYAGMLSSVMRKDPISRLRAKDVNKLSRIVTGEDEPSIIIP